MTAAAVARMPVEPLRLVLERHGVDVALVALVAAWLPAARALFAERRRFLAAALLLVPIALATPRLTPPMYGDEPFHLVVLLVAGPGLGPRARQQPRPRAPAAQPYLHHR